jgi:hypothetical protein
MNRFTNTPFCKQGLCLSSGRSIHSVDFAVRLDQSGPEPARGTPLLRGYLTELSLSDLYPKAPPILPIRGGWIDLHYDTVVHLARRA